MMVKHKKLKRRRLLLKVLFMTLGGITMGVGLEFFLIPNSISDGGVVGISIMLSHLLGIPLGALLFTINLPFFYIGYKQIGKTFALSSLYSVAIFSITATLFHHYKEFTADPLLASVFGGILLGIGIGIVIREGGSTDGAEIMAILFSKKSAFSVGEFIMFINFFILGSAGFVFGWDKAMYSLITYFIAFKVIDIVIVGLDESKSAMIISDLPEEIGAAIRDRLGRGVTYLNGTGGYTHEQKKVIYCVVTRLEEAKLQSIVDDIDENAFLAIANVAEVRGGRFKKKDIH
ncbi:MAG: hypothetical protein K0R71_645 [Bacillales bacterium]|jgi:uncharacterized membrane-anchored protein YitT (DUF2179 family)|nr:hypothetical protein [Bacillales bacterium]